MRLTSGGRTGIPADALTAAPDLSPCLQLPHRRHRTPSAAGSPLPRDRRGHPLFCLLRALAPPDEHADEIGAWRFSRTDVQGFSQISALRACTGQMKTP